MATIQGVVFNQVNTVGIKYCFQLPILIQWIKIQYRYIKMAVDSEQMGSRLEQHNGIFPSEEIQVNGGSTVAITLLR